MEGPGEGYHDYFGIMTKENVLNSNRIFWTKFWIGVASIVIFISGIAVKAIWPKELQPVSGDIDSLMILSSGIFGGLVRDVLGFPVKQQETSNGPSQPATSGDSGSPKP